MSHWTDTQKQAFWAAHKRGDKLLYYLTDRYGRPANGGKNNLPPAAPGIVHTTSSRKICNHGLHATSEPHRWNGELVWVVALGPDAETGGDGGKWCSTRREFIGLILPEESIICGGVAVKNGSKIAPRSDLRSADLESADLRSADLRYADLRSADLEFADLRSADLEFADLRSADLEFADLRSANLESADLEYADLRSANAGLSPSPITVARLADFGWTVDSDGYIRRKS